MLKLATPMAAIAVAFAVPTPSHATWDTGNSYWERCAAKDNVVCQATASAYLDMMETNGYECATENVTRTQAKDVLLKFLRENPAQRHGAAASLAVVAFTKAFGCTKPEK